MTTNTLDKKIGVTRTQLLSLPQLICIVLMLVVLIAIAWCRVAVINSEYQISTLEAGVRKARGDLQALQIEVASLRQPGRIERIARKELGFIISDPNRVVTVQRDGSAE